MNTDVHCNREEAGHRNNQLTPKHFAFHIFDSIIQTILFNEYYQPYFTTAETEVHRL